MKLILGTANFLSPYNNEFIDEAKATRILDLARRLGVYGIDTAEAYGNTEFLSRWNGKFEITTKYKNSPKEIRFFKNPLVLAHDPLKFALVDKFSYGFKRHGVSIYGLKDLPEDEVDLIQCPVSVFDQRLVPYLKTWKEKGIEVQVRSIFLRGKLLKPDGSKYFKAISDFGLSPVEAAVDFIKRLPINAFVFGVSSEEDLIQIVEAFRRPNSGFNFKPYAKDSVLEIDPRFWANKSN